MTFRSFLFQKNLLKIKISFLTLVKVMYFSKINHQEAKETINKVINTNFTMKLACKNKEIKSSSNAI